MKPEPPKDVRVFVVDIDLPPTHRRVVSVEWDAPARPKETDEQYSIEIKNNSKAA